MAKKYLYQSLGMFVMAAAMVFGAISAIPWASKEEVRELKEDYEYLITLKNQDNKWYQELAERVAGMESDISNIEEHVREIKELIRKK